MSLIDHYKPVTSNWLFWLLTATPAALGFVLGIIVWSAMEPSFTGTGYETFLRVGTLPLGLMGLAFPLGGIYGLVHKSKQLSQQILDERLKRLYERSLPVVNSIDAILVHLYRLRNHSHLLNDWIIGGKRDAEQIKKKLQIIIESWSSLYTEARFFPAMARVGHQFENLDAVMCGYERGLTDHVITGKVVFTKEMQDDLSDKFSELEQHVLEYRKMIEREYFEQANSMVESFGLSSKTKIRSHNKPVDSQGDEPSRAGDVR